MSGSTLPAFKFVLLAALVAPQLCAATVLRPLPNLALRFESGANGTEDKPVSSLLPTPIASAMGTLTSSDDHGNDGASATTESSSPTASTTHNGDDSPTSTFSSTPTAAAGFTAIVVNMSSSALTFTGDWVDAPANSSAVCGGGTAKSVSGSAGVSGVKYTFTGTKIYLQSTSHDAHYTITLDGDVAEFEAHDDSGHDTRALHLRASNKDTSDDPAGHDANDDNGGHNVNDDNGGSGSIGNGTCAYRYVRTGLADGSHTLEINVLGRNSNSTDMDVGDDNPGAGNKEEWSFVLQSFVVIQNASTATSGSANSSSTTNGNSNANTTGSACSVKGGTGMVAALAAAGVWMLP
ncbi:hypothetical protein B0H14DRAFT_2732314 [Mycena olivaceomarginata]|nr:hypothetical protein B0H14DRAFT_2732314 [Mycena olivaceomarginata]